jgi:YD repeat-containing protein
VEFTRDGSGRVTGMLMSTGRTRKVRFEKTPPG